MKAGRIEYETTIVLLTLTLFSVVGLTLPRAMAGDGVVDSIEITVNVACSMASTVTGGHTETMMNGETSQIGGTTTLKAICNDNSGYAIYAIGYTDDEYGKAVLTDSTLGSDYDIATSSTINTSTSSWAMKLTKAGSSYLPIIAGSSDDNDKVSGDPDFSDYTAVPGEYTKVVYFPSSTDAGTGALGSNVEATYRAYISRAQLAGTYIGQVKYTLVHPNTAAAPEVPFGPLNPSLVPENSIIYAPNTSDTQGDMSSLGTTTVLSNASPNAGKVSVSPNSTTQLIAPNFYREGYGFAGWSTDFVATSTSTIYGPNETISTNPTNGGLDVSSGAILYPVWVESSGTLQEFSCASSSLTPATYDSTTGKVSATLSSITALTDSRDENTYAVARLADGYCWMIENLRLDANHSTDSSLAQGYDTGFIGLPASEDANFDSNGTANNLYSTGNYRTMPRYNNNNIKFGGKNAYGTDLIAGYNTNTNTAQWYSYGNYYSWPAAKATITNYTSYSASDAVSTSICPAGWILPLGYQSTGTLENGSSDTANRVRGFSYLDRVMGGTGGNQSSTAGTTQSTKWRSFPNNFVYSGYWGGAQARDRSSYGRYWSSSAYSGSSSYRLYLVSSSVHPGTDRTNKLRGASVRCVSGS